MAGLRTGVSLLVSQHFCLQPIKKKKAQDVAAKHPLQNKTLKITCCHHRFIFLALLEEIALYTSKRKIRGCNSMT